MFVTAAKLGTNNRRWKTFFGNLDKIGKVYHYWVVTKDI